MGDLTYKKLQKAVTDLAKDVAKGSEAIRSAAQWIDEEAQDTSRVAEAIGGMGVDRETVSETHELSKAMRGVSEGAIDYASSGDNTTKAAKAAYEQAHTTHNGIQEAYSRSTVNISNLNREWLRQE